MSAMYPTRIPKDPFEETLYRHALTSHVKQWHTDRYTASVGKHRGDGTYPLTILGHAAYDTPSNIVVGMVVDQHIVTGSIWIVDKSYDDTGRLGIEWETPAQSGQLAHSGDEYYQPPIFFSGDRTP